MFSSRRNVDGSSERKVHGRRSRVVCKSDHNPDHDSKVRRETRVLDVQVERQVGRRDRQAGREARRQGANTHPPLSPHGIKQSLRKFRTCHLVSNKHYMTMRSM